MKEESRIEVKKEWVIELCKDCLSKFVEEINKEYSEKVGWWIICAKSEYSGVCFNACEICAGNSEIKL